MRKLLLLLGAALCGGFLYVPAVSAMAAPAAPLPAQSAVVPASGSPPKVFVLVSVQTPTLTRVTVVSGDTLWGIGVRTNRTWEQLASYNHVPNPNLIYVGQAITVPPANFVGGVVAVPVQTYSPPVHRNVVHATYHYQPTYTPRAAPVVSAPRYNGASSGFQACVISRESGGNAQIRSPSGTYWGLYQFSYSTWVANGGNPGSYGSASAGEQTQVFNRSSPSNWAPYDGC